MHAQTCAIPCYVCVGLVWSLSSGACNRASYSSASFRGVEAVGIGWGGRVAAQVLCQRSSMAAIVAYTIYAR